MTQTSPANIEMDRNILSIEEIDTFYGPSHILSNVSLEINEEEIVALVGRNGAGKTTTLRSIMGLTPPKSGVVVFKDEEITGSPPYKIRRQGISWVPESCRIFNTTVQQNLNIATYAGRGNDDIQMVYDLFPRLKERKGQNAATLSGGEQQMLAIARSLLGPKPELLMLDEPSEGLAPSIVNDVYAAIERLNNDGIPILLVEQDVKHTLTIADRAYIMETGRIVYEGDAEDLLEDEDTMEEYLGVS